MSGEMTATRWPDVYIVGAGRSGTTAIHEILRQHPGLRVCDRKSPNYFVADFEQPEWETPQARVMAQHWTRSEREYRAMFSGARPDQVLLEASPVYLQALGVAERIHAANPKAKIIAILRDPAQRAFAHFLGRKRDGIESAETFRAWMDRVSSRPLPTDIAFGHYIGCGQYHHFLQQYLETFGPDRVHIAFYDDFTVDPDALIRSLLEFVGVDPRVALDSSLRANQSGEIGNRVLRQIWTSTVGVRTRLRPMIPEPARRSIGRIFLSDLARPPLAPDARSEIIELLEDDIRATASLTGRDLSAWLV